MLMSWLKLYEAALLTSCYTYHGLRPYTDYEINHKRHFIKIVFINKGMEFIGLRRIFKDIDHTSLLQIYRSYGNLL